MSWSTGSSQINVGDEVYGSDGDKVGTVAEVQSSYIVVEKGFFFPTDYYVPMSSVASADSNQVYLDVAKDAALQSGWDAQPVDLETATFDTTTVTDTTNVGTGYAASDVGAGYGLGTGQREVAGYEATAEDEIRIPVMEEELTATVREQEAGAVRVEKDVVTEERVRVERRIVDRPVTAGDAAAFDEMVIDVPLTTETVEVQKQVRVAEEVVLSKEAVQHTKQVRDTVRREEVFVDEDATTLEGGETRSSGAI